MEFIQQCDNTDIHKYKQPPKKDLQYIKKKLDNWWEENIRRVRTQKAADDIKNDYDHPNSTY